MSLPRNRFENSNDECSDLPGTDYTIAYQVGEVVRKVTIRSQSAITAFKEFKESMPDLFKRCSVNKIETPPPPEPVKQKKIVRLSVKKDIPALRDGIWQPRIESNIQPLHKELPDNWRRPKAQYSNVQFGELI